MSDIPRKRRKGPVVREVPAPVLRVYPQHRAGLDPSIIRPLTAYLIAQNREWSTKARQTWSGYRGVERDRRKGEVLWARQMVEALTSILDRLTDTVCLRDVDAIYAEWDAALVAQGSR